MPVTDIAVGSLKYFFKGNTMDLEICCGDCGWSGTDAFLDYSGDDEGFCPVCGSYNIEDDLDTEEF